MKKAKLLLLSILLIAIILGSYSLFFKEEKVDYSLIEVAKGTVIQEVSETGSVKKGEEINLTFKNSGKIEKIYVVVGNKIKAGENLAKLDTTQLNIQLKEAQANLEVTQAQLNQFLAGSTPEEIQIAKTAVSNAKVALEDANQKLEDVKADAQEDLDNTYEDALNTLGDSYLKAYNAYNDAQEIQRSYFNGRDQESLSVQENRNKIRNNLNQMEDSLDVAKSNSGKEDIDDALKEFKVNLENIYDALTVIRNKTETISYRNVVSSADKTSLDTNKTNINTALTNAINDQQAISTAKLTNGASINTAEAQVSTVEGNLKEAQDNLLLVTADPRQEDIDLYQAKIRQAEAQTSLLQSQILDAIIKSPVAGQITEIEKEVGEIAQPTEAVISILPSKPFQIEVDIYEEDIVKMEIGNSADIELAAFPEEVFKGRVILMDPAEKIIDGVVYYEITIDFEDIPQNVKPGMTADIIITTAKKENVLIIPESAIKKKGGKTTVEIISGDALEEREIEVGLIGSDDLVEVTSGLVEGEKVAIR